MNFVNHNRIIGRLFREVDNLLEEEGGSPPLEPDDMDGESDPVDPIGDNGEVIFSVNQEYASAIDTLKGAQAFLDGIGSWTDKGEAKVLVSKAKEKASKGLKEIQKAIKKLEAL